MGRPRIHKTKTPCHLTVNIDVAMYDQLYSEAVFQCALSKPQPNLAETARQILAEYFTGPKFAEHMLIEMERKRKCRSIHNRTSTQQPEIGKNGNGSYSKRITAS